MSNQNPSTRSARYAASAAVIGLAATGGFAFLAAQGTASTQADISTSLTDAPTDDSPHSDGSTDSSHRGDDSSRDGLLPGSSGRSDASSHAS